MDRVRHQALVVRIPAAPQAHPVQWARVAQQVRQQQPTRQQRLPQPLQQVRPFHKWHNKRMEINQFFKTFHHFAHLFIIYFHQLKAETLPNSKFLQIYRKIQ